jgi:hypothetical protein
MVTEWTETDCIQDIIFNFQKAYFILDELLLAGEMQESSKKNVLRVISAQDSIEDTEVSTRHIPLSCSSLRIQQVKHHTSNQAVSSHLLILPPSLQD